jgi:hypothetical protein
MERICTRIFPCAECKKEFTSRASLHKHLKQHDLNLASYYTKHFPRINKLTGDPLPFKRYEEYFGRDFSTKQQLLKWCEESPTGEVKEYALSLLEKRHLKKQRKYGPFHLETKNSFLPSVAIYRKLFGSYNAACKKIGCEPLYNKNIPKDFFTMGLPSDLTIAVDTREQKPLKFKECESETLKLDIGDYTALGEHYDYTFVDRKSGNDLQGTVGKHNIDRFKREIERAQEMDAYLFVVIESSVEKIIKENKVFNRKANIDYTLRQIKDISHTYPRACQFIFTGNRERAAKIIPRILIAGKSIWSTDMQYFLDQS